MFLKPVNRKIVDDGLFEPDLDVFDPKTGLVRDQKRLRVRMTAMDAAPPQRTAGASAMSAWAPWTDSVLPPRGQRFCEPVRDYSPPPVRDAAPRAAPGRRAARRLARQVTASSSATSTTDAAKIADALAATQAAIQSGRVEVADAYASHRPGFVADYDRSASETAYLEMCRDLQDAWRSPAQQAAPAPALAEPQVAKPIAAAVADVVPSPTMSVSDAQKIRDAAYREYVERISNEWKS